MTSTPEPDGSVLLHLTSEPGDFANHLYVMDGWNYAIRLYRPRPAVLDGTWSRPRRWPWAEAPPPRRAPAREHRAGRSGRCGARRPEERYMEPVAVIFVIAIVIVGAIALNEFRRRS